LVAACRRQAALVRRQQRSPAARLRCNSRESDPHIEEPPMAQTLIACRTASYDSYQAVAYEHLASLGVRHVEVPVPKADELEATKVALAGFGLSASSLHGECNVGRADVARQVEDQMPAFAALGTKIMFVSVKVGDTPRETAYARLREAGDVAARHGVTIALETHPDLITNGDVALETMRAVDHPYVRINFDTANVYFYNQGIDGVAELRKVAKFVAAVHLKDTDGGYRHWHFPALGRGIVDFREVFATLDGVGFNGPYTLEIEGIEGQEQTERHICDRIAESAGYLRGLGRL
jgi:L-ribulose-5-phosphate 3-epimerase